MAVVMNAQLLQNYKCLKEVKHDAILPSLTWNI